MAPENRHHKKQSRHPVDKSRTPLELSANRRAAADIRLQRLVFNVLVVEICAFSADYGAFNGIQNQRAHILLTIKVAHALDRARISVDGASASRRSDRPVDVTEVPILLDEGKD